MSEHNMVLHKLKKNFSPVQHLWFLLGIMAKSMSQYLSICGKDSVSKSAIPSQCCCYAFFTPTDFIKKEPL